VVVQVDQVGRVVQLFGVASLTRHLPQPFSIADGEPQRHGCGQRRGQVSIPSAGEQHQSAAGQWPAHFS